MLSTVVLSNENQTCRGWEAPTSTGGGGCHGYPIQEATQIAILAVVEWFNAHPDTVMHVYFCCFKDSEFATYQNFLASL